VVKSWVIRLLRRLLAWLDPPPDPEIVIPVLDPVQALASQLITQANALMDTTGEYRRHWVYAKLIKAFPDRRKRDLSMAIEVAVHAKGE